MSANHQRLDESIDQVASRMVRVADNDDLASKIISALPERVTWFGWLTHSWAPRLAMVAVVVTAGIVWGNRRSQPIAPPALPIASAPTIATPIALVATVRELAPEKPLEPGTKLLEPLEPLEPVEPASVDHERSLPAISAVASLELDSLAPVSLPEDAPLTLAPLAIDELPLTAETISPRE